MGQGMTGSEPDITQTQTYEPDIRDSPSPHLSSDTGEDPDPDICSYQSESEPEPVGKAQGRSEIHVMQMNVTSLTNRTAHYIISNTKEDVICVQEHRLGPRKLAYWKAKFGRFFHVTANVAPIHLSLIHISEPTRPY